MDTSEEYIKMSDCPEIQGCEFDNMPNFHFAYNFGGIWRIEHDILGGQNDKKVWLPRQDQIQEMFRNDCTATGIGSIQLIDWIDAWIEERSGLNLIGEYSMEEIWLRFYMHKKHKKVWDGEKWVGS